MKAGVRFTTYDQLKGMLRDDEVSLVRAACDLVKMVWELDKRQALMFNPWL